MIGGVVTLGPPAQCKQTRSINKSKQADYIVNQFYGRVFRDTFDCGKKEYFSSL